MMARAICTGENEALVTALGIGYSRIINRDLMITIRIFVTQKLMNRFPHMESDLSGGLPAIGRTVNIQRKSNHQNQNRRERMQRTSLSETVTVRRWGNSSSGKYVPARRVQAIGLSWLHRRSRATLPMPPSLKSSQQPPAAECSPAQDHQEKRNWIWSTPESSFLSWRQRA